VRFWRGPVRSPTGSRSFWQERSRLASTTNWRITNLWLSTARGSSWVNWPNLRAGPALIHARALEPGEALIIAPEQLRAMLIAEVELGERIMRALILRRVNLLERGVGGPIIVGRADNGDVLRLAGSLPDLTPLRKKGTRRAVRLLQLNPRFYRHSEIRLVRTRDFGVLSDVVFMWVFGADNLLPLCYQRAPIRFDVAHLSGSRAAPKSLLQDQWIGPVVETRCVNFGVT
jgi:hypothetical protein